MKTAQYAALRRTSRRRLKAQPVSTLGLYKAIAELPERHYDVVLLTFVLDLERRKVAQLMGISTTTVRSHIYTARRMLAEKIDLDWTPGEEKGLRTTQPATLPDRRVKWTTRLSWPPKSSPATTPSTTRPPHAAALPSAWSGTARAWRFRAPRAVPCSRSRTAPQPPAGGCRPAGPTVSWCWTRRATCGRPCSRPARPGSGRQLGVHPDRFGRGRLALQPAVRPSVREPAAPVRPDGGRPVLVSVRRGRRLGHRCPRPLPPAPVPVRGHHRSPLAEADHQHHQRRRGRPARPAYRSRGPGILPGCLRHLGLAPPSPPPTWPPTRPPTSKPCASSPCRCTGR
ncbi:sigma-70 family RNA polymerase sigma factor [Streptomyces spororaveus]|uniref:sigma-70 family RNA polymerase sigma factor n=1 Tax=Streptomyces spororaveus TaxID=284039 RepID=UPI001F1E8247|nr:sigma-70 family RNA polymerase sigma factor [Streptomyces spororaveus]